MLLHLKKKRHGMVNTHIRDSITSECSCNEPEEAKGQTRCSLLKSQLSHFSVEWFILIFTFDAPDRKHWLCMGSSVHWST